MQKLPFRTNNTDLSQNELLLLDILFRGAAQLRSLRREHFRATWNWHGHNLDDAELNLTIGRLCGRGILDTERAGDTTYVRLTQNGGRFWSLERCPVWERYATEGYDETISGKPFVTVIATSASIRDDFLALGGPGGTWRLNNSRVRRFEIRRHALIPWHPFSRLFVAVVMNLDDDRSIAPAAYRQHLLAHEQRRTWWRSVFELQKFLLPTT
jgi:hypothetical protein